MASDLLLREVLREISKAVTPLMKKAKPLYREDKKVSHATAQDVKDFLKSLLEVEQHQQHIIGDMFQIGGAMYSIATQVTVAKAIINNPIQDAGKITAKPNHETFK